MHCQTVKDEHITCVDSASNPIAPQRFSLWNCRNVPLVVVLKTEMVGAFQNL